MTAATAGQAATDLATLLDLELRDAAATAAEGVAEVIRIMGEARSSGVHAILGYKSFTAYLADALRPLHQQLQGSFRRELVQAMADAGMSQRAIAHATGESKTTIQRELAVTRGGGQLVQGGPPDRVTGLDGKSYARNPARPSARSEALAVIGRALGAARRSERLEAFERVQHKRHGPPELRSLRQFLAGARSASESGLANFETHGPPELREEGRRVVLEWVSDFRRYLDEIETYWAQPESTEGAHP